MVMLLETARPFPRRTNVSTSTVVTTPVRNEHTPPMSPSTMTNVRRGSDLQGLRVELLGPRLVAGVGDEAGNDDAATVGDPAQHAVAGAVERLRDATWCDVEDDQDPESAGENLGRGIQPAVLQQAH